VRLSCNKIQVELLLGIGSVDCVVVSVSAPYSKSTTAYAGKTHLRM